MADDVLEVYELENIEQLRAVSDSLRIRIIDLLRQQAMTVTQMGERLGIAPAKVHYHVRELERVGLLRLVETREKGGVLEKYYRTIARDFRVPSKLLRGTPPDEVLATMSNMLNALSNGVLRALEIGLRHPERRDEPHIGLSNGSVYMTEDESRRFMGKLEELLKPYEVPRGVAGEHERTFAYLSYPTMPEDERQT